MPGSAGLREVRGRFIRSRRRVHGACDAGCVPEHPGAREDLAGWSPRRRSRYRRIRRRGASACGFGELYGPVRGCPQDRRWRSRRARTYSGQRRRDKHHGAVFMQVRGYVEVQAGAGCKTVGPAYVGSNPTPATTCENSPWAAETRPGGPFPSCHATYQGVSLRVDVAQWLRTYDVPRPGGTSGAFNRSLCRSAPVLPHYPGAGTVPLTDVPDIRPAGPVLRRPARARGGLALSVPAAGAGCPIGPNHPHPIEAAVEALAECPSLPLG